MKPWPYLNIRQDPISSRDIWAWQNSNLLTIFLTCRHLSIVNTDFIHDNAKMSFSSAPFSFRLLIKQYWIRSWWLNKLGAPTVFYTCLKEELFEGDLQQSLGCFCVKFVTFIPHFHVQPKSRDEIWVESPATPFCDLHWENTSSWLGLVTSWRWASKSVRPLLCAFQCSTSFSCMQ